MVGYEVSPHKMIMYWGLDLELVALSLDVLETLGGRPSFGRSRSLGVVSQGRDFGLFLSVCFLPITRYRKSSSSCSCHHHAWGQSSHGLETSETGS
jgi:hypothetical protein